MTLFIDDNATFLLAQVARQTPDALDNVRAMLGKRDTKAEAPPVVSIIILTFNQLADTKLCLQSIEKHTPEAHELILVDNASTDGTIDYLRAYAKDRAHVRVIANRKNYGFPGGNNLGMALCQAPYVMLLNNDTVVTPNWLASLVSVCDSDPQIGLVGPCSNHAPGHQQVASEYANLDALPQFARQWTEAHQGQTELCLKLVGFCLLIRREVIDQLGGLDERFGRGNYEDDDFCIRAVRAGYRPRVSYEVFIHHSGGKTWKGQNLEYDAHMSRNWSLFKSKWGIDPNTETWTPDLASLDPTGDAKIPLPELKSRYSPDGAGRWWQENP